MQTGVVGLLGGGGALQVWFGVMCLLGVYVMCRCTSVCGVFSRRGARGLQVRCTRTQLKLTTC